MRLHFRSSRELPPADTNRCAFSLIELIVVIGLIAFLIAILAPSFARIRQQANTIRCQSNLRVLGQMLLIYSNQNRGWFYPVGVDSTASPAANFGINRPPNERWPVLVFKFDLPAVMPFDPAAYVQYPYDPVAYPAQPYTPPILTCPSDVEPFESHSYVLNSHLAEHGIKAGHKDFGGLTVSDVIMAGEKVTIERDYFMQNEDFDRVVERYRHGSRQGSNYLYLDTHVGTVLPPEAKAGIDPWDLRSAEPTSVPTP